MQNIDQRAIVSKKFWRYFWPYNQPYLLHGRPSGLPFFSGMIFIVPRSTLGFHGRPWWSIVVPRSTLSVVLARSTVLFQGRPCFVLLFPTSFPPSVSESLFRCFFSWSISLSLSHVRSLLHSNEEEGSKEPPSIFPENPSTHEVCLWHLLGSHLQQGLLQSSSGTQASHQELSWFARGLLSLYPFQMWFLSFPLRCFYEVTVSLFYSNLDSSIVDEGEEPILCSFIKDTPLEFLGTCWTFTTVVRSMFFFPPSTLLLCFLKQSSIFL